MGTTYSTWVKTQLQQQLDSIQKVYQFTGATFAVVMPDGQAINLATGLSNLATQTPMKPNDKMLLGSIGKTYVAPIIMQLVEAEQLKLDDKLSQYFGKEDWYSKLPNANDLTIRMLLNHTGGLPRYVLDPALWELAIKNPNKTWTGVERLSYIFGKPAVHPAGKGWAYSDTDYILLGMLIEQLTGKDFYKVLKKRILKPYKLKATKPSNKRKLKGIVQGHSGKSPLHTPDLVIQNKKYFINPQLEWTGGGLMTNSLDLAKWIKLLHEGKVVSKTSTKMMQQPMNETTGQPDTVGYGFATQVRYSKQGISYEHSGFMPGYLSITQYFPKYGFSCAMQINSDIFYPKMKVSKSVALFISLLRPTVADYIKENVSTYKLHQHKNQ